MNELTEEQRRRIEENRLKALERKRTREKVKEETANEVEEGYATPTNIGDHDDEDKKVGFRSPVIHQISPIKSHLVLSPQLPSSSSQLPICEHILPETMEICGSANIDKQLFDSFKEKVCQVCRIKNPEVYGLLSKQECMKQFLLPDDTFQLFPHMTKPNPHNVNWIPMKLYLIKQVQGYALVRYGTLENIEKERQKRDQQKYERSLLKTENLLKKKSDEFKDFIGQQKQYTDLSEKASNDKSEVIVGDNDLPVENKLTEKKKRQLTEKQQKQITKKQKFLNNFTSVFNQSSEK